MNRIALLIALVLIPCAALAESITWENDGVDGWAEGDNWDAANIDEVKREVDDNAADIDLTEGRLDVVENDYSYYVPDDGILNQEDIHAAITAACTQTTNLHAKCREIVLPAGTFALTDTVYITDTSNDGPDAATGEGVWGLKLRGSGGAYIQTEQVGGATNRCATTLIWDGPTASPMIWIHAGRNVVISDLCLILDGDQDGTTGTPPASHGIIATSNSGEISEGVVIRNVDIYGFSSSWTNSATYSSTCVALLPSDYSGDPPYSTSTQVDAFVLDTSRLLCHKLFLGANGSSGTNGTAIRNVNGKYSDYGLWAESSDLQVYGGKWVTWQGYGSGGAAGTSCTNSEAWLKIGNTSNDQAKTVSVVGATVEGDCGEAVMTVDATTASNQRFSSTSLVNTSINWGAAGEDHVINYTHKGVLEIIGGFFGIRNAEDYTTSGRVFISALPDTRTGSTLALRIEGAGLNDWSANNIRVETNSQVELINADDIELSDDYDWTGAHDFSGGSIVIPSAPFEIPGGCLIIRDSDDAGNSACAVLNGTFSCEIDTNDTCGDAT